VFHHTVQFIFPDATPPAVRAAIVDELRALPGRIPEIRRYAAGLDLGLRDGNAHLAVVAEFDDEAAYVTYRDHPAHRRVVAELIDPTGATRRAAQFRD
jgi:hypothetical protein